MTGTDDLTAWLEPYGEGDYEAAWRAMSAEFRRTAARTLLTGDGRHAPSRRTVEALASADLTHPLAPRLLALFSHPSFLDAFAARL